MTLAAFACVLAAVPAVAADAVPARAANVLPEDATAAEMVACCRTMLPGNAELAGRIILRNRRGTVQAEHAYVLRRAKGATALDVDGTRLERDDGQGAIMGTDVTWSDLTLDYLWWDDVSFDAERESETVHGQKCCVIVLKSADRIVRAWVDRKTGAMMQAEEIADGRPVRRLWGTRIKKFGDRWAPNVLEVETLGSGHRTKITVERLDVKETT